jgi:DNA-binding response OmpR family regulator
MTAILKVDTSVPAYRGFRIREPESSDLVLLHLDLPDRSGLELCRALRAVGSGIDVLVVTSARDLAPVRSRCPSE